MDNKKKIHNIISSITMAFFIVTIPFATCTACNLYADTKDVTLLIVSIILAIDCIVELLLVAYLFYKLDD